MFVKQIENGLDLTDISRSIAAIFDTSLGPGQSIQPHYHTDLEEIYYVLSGSGLLTIDDEQKEISRGDVVHIPPPAPHTLLNTGNVPLRFITLTVSVSSQSEGYDAHPYIF